MSVYFLGIDIGSTAVKACVAGDGRVAGRGSAGYPTDRLPDGRVEQDPGDWYRAAAEAVRAAVADAGISGRRIAGIGLSAQGGAMYAAGRGGAPLTPAASWMDRRAGAEAKEEERLFGAERIRRMCGWPPSASDCLAKLMKLRREDPALFYSAGRFLTTCESVTARLTGHAVTDPTGQAITRLYDYRSGTYFSDALEYLGIGEEKFASVLPCGCFAGGLLPEAAADLGLEAGTPVYNGAHDQYCASIGSGVTEPGQLLVATGTAWVLFGVSDRIIDAPPYPAACAHPASGRYGVMTSMSGCGGALGAYAESKGRTLRELDGEIVSRGLADGKGGRFVCPLPEMYSVAHREGVCRPLGDDPSYDPAETALAAMESIAFESRILIEAFEAAGFPRGDEVVMSGGASKSPLWRGILADVLGDRRLFMLCEPDAPALGAALIASVSAGAYPSLAEASAAFSARAEVPSDPGRSANYGEKYLRYREWALK